METDPVTIFLFLKMRAGEVSCDPSETLRPGYRGLVQVAPGKESKDKSTLGILEFSRETEPVGENITYIYMNENERSLF